jgi:hypothetical protein
VEGSTKAKDERRSAVSLRATLLAGPVLVAACSGTSVASSGSASLTGLPASGFGASAPAGTKVASAILEGDAETSEATVALYADAPGISCSTLSGYPLALLAIDAEDGVTTFSPSALAGQTLSFTKGGTVGGVPVAPMLQVYDYVANAASVPDSVTWETGYKWVASAGSVTFAADASGGLSGTFTATLEPASASGPKAMVKGSFTAPACE